MAMCPRCKQDGTYVRELRCSEGLVLEDWHTCGWSKPRVLLLAGMAKVTKPATAKDWRPSGIHQQAVEAGKKGGKARASRLALKAVNKAKEKRKPYARKNPRKIREVMGYLHTGALDTFMPGWSANMNFVDPTS